MNIANAPEESTMSREILTDFERDYEDAVLRFADGSSFKLSYLAIRTHCQCANCKPRQENDQRRIEFEEEVARLRVERPRVNPVGRYGIQLEWPTGCSSGIHSFTHLREVCEGSGTLI